MEKLQSISVILGIVGFIGSIIAGFIGELAASYFMSGFGGIFLIVWFLIKRRRAPRVRYFRNEIEINSTKKNRRNLNGAFVGWQKCTVLFWVLVPPNGQALRNAADYRYILAHQTNDPRENTNRNLFALRYTPSKQWELAISNDRGEFPRDSFVIPDGLQSGWHQFILEWDHSRPELVISIDKQREGEARSKTYLPFWPQRQADNVVIGSWLGKDPYSDSYCETMLFELRVYDDFISLDDSRISKHFELKE